MQECIFRDADAAEATRPSSTSGWGKRAKRYAPHALIALTVLCGFLYVYAFGVDLYWGDDWSVRPRLLDHYANGSLRFAELWHQHNEHRIFFPKLVMLALGRLFHGNALADMYVSQILLVAILGIFLFACRNQLPRDRAVWLMVPIAFLVFNLRQHENMLWAFQISFIMVVVAASTAFLCLSRIRNERYIPNMLGAILAATVGAYSSIQGLLIWPVGLGLLLIGTTSKRRKIVLMSIWTILGAAVWLRYFQNWESPGHHPALLFSPHYFFLAIGGALSSDIHWALATGILLAILATLALVLVFVKRQWQEQSFWLATMGFSLATLAAITMGRSGFGPGQSLASRYSTYSIPLVIAVFVIFASQSREKPNRLGTHCLRATLALVLIGVTICFLRGVVIGHQWSQDRVYQRFVLCTIESQPDEAISFLRSPEIRLFAATLKKLKYSAYADPLLQARSELPAPSLPVLASAAQCGFNNLITEADGALLIVGGWAVDPLADDVADSVSVVIDGKAYPACYGLQRLDVVKKLGKPHFLHSGFRCPVLIKNIGPGNHSLVLKVRSHDRNAVYEISEPFEIDRKLECVRRLDMGSRRNAL